MRIFYAKIFKPIDFSTSGDNFAYAEIFDEATNTWSKLDVPAGFPKYWADFLHAPAQDGQVKKLLCSIHQLLIQGIYLSGGYAYGYPEDNLYENQDTYYFNPTTGDFYSMREEYDNGPPNAKGPWKKYQIFN